ncbi:hypothetical protein PENTCL1PPCAC_7619, partial [Pristionchus entomophagus]
IQMPTKTLLTFLFLFLATVEVESFYTKQNVTKSENETINGEKRAADQTAIEMDSLKFPIDLVSKSDVIEDFDEVDEYWQ